MQDDTPLEPGDLVVIHQSTIEASPHYMGVVIDVEREWPIERELPDQYDLPEEYSALVLFPGKAKPVWYVSFLLQRVQQSTKKE